MNKKDISMAMAILFSLVSAGAGQETLTLKDTERDIIMHSDWLRAVGQEYESALKKADSARAVSGPKLTIDGYYRYVTHVPELSLPVPGMAQVKLGDNNNYSIGPTISWLAWDHGGAGDSYRSFQAVSKSKKYEVESARRQLLLGGRIAYFSLLLSRVQTAVLQNAVSLAQSQYDDIKINVRAGAKSRMDEIAARQELLTRWKQLRQAQAETAQSLIELSQATGRRFDAAAPPGLDNVDDLIRQCRDCGTQRLWADHPNIKAFDELSAAARYAQSSFASGLWPKVSLQARSSLEYPDQTKQESFIQNMIAVNFSWALFEEGFSRAKADENGMMAAAAQDRKAQAQSDMQVVWDKAEIQRANLQDQKELDEEMVRGTEELAGIVFSAYKAGTVSYLQVEDANIKALESKLSLARTNIQMLVQYATLSSLSEE